MARKIANIGGQYWPLVEMPDFLTIWPKVSKKPACQKSRSKVSKKPVESVKKAGKMSKKPVILVEMTGFFDTFGQIVKKAGRKCQKSR